MKTSTTFPPHFNKVICITKYIKKSKVANVLCCTDGGARSIKLSHGIFCRIMIKTFNLTIT